LPLDRRRAAVCLTGRERGPACDRASPTRTSPRAHPVRGGAGSESEPYSHITPRTAGAVRRRLGKRALLAHHPAHGRCGAAQARIASPARTSPHAQPVRGGAGSDCEPCSHITPRTPGAVQRRLGLRALLAHHPAHSRCGAAQARKASPTRTSPRARPVRCSAGSDCEPCSPRHRDFTSDMRGGLALGRSAGPTGLSVARRARRRLTGGKATAVSPRTPTS
jgi:hypothetical protein